MIRTLEERLIYSNKYVRVYDDLVEFPDGSRGTYYYSRWTAPFGVAVVPVAGRRVLLVDNHRYGEETSGLEVPQGFGREDCSRAENAARELHEETGIMVPPDRLDYVCGLGGAYKTHIFRADLSRSDVPSAGNTESSEDIGGFTWVELNDVRPESMAAMRINDAVTAFCLLYARQFAT